jgi:hypothetical protein
MDDEQLTQLLIIAMVFGTIAFVARAAIDGLVRYKALRDGVPPDGIVGAMQTERAARRLGALRWGLLATAEAGALLAIDQMSLAVNSAAALACLFLAAGAAQLVFFAATRPR